MNDESVKEGRKSARSWGKAVSRFVVACSLIPVLLFAFTFLARQFYLAELMVNFRAQLMLMLLPFPILLGLLKQWRWCLTLGVVCLFAVYGVGYVYFPADQPSAGPTKLKIMSFNVLGHNFDQYAVADRVREHNPDVLTVVEYSNHWEEVFKEFYEEYPYRVLEPRWHGFGIAMFSKFPIIDSEVRMLTEKSTDNPCIVAKLQVEDQELRVAGMHVLSPTNVFRMKLRNAQIKEMAQILNQRQEPTVLVGDFNCVPWSPVLVDFLKSTELRDSRQGFGYQPSWHVKLWPMMIPIDHAFVSEQVHVHDRMLGDAAGSDHLPLVLEISITE